MNRDSIIDYWSCTLFKLLGPIIRSLPLSFSLFLGRRLGDLFYYFDLKHKALAYANIRTALGEKLSCSQIADITKKFYRTYGQNLIEIFFIPLINKDYIKKYIIFEGLDYINEAFKIGKGVILLGVHEGGWELSNIISSNLGFPFFLFVRGQRHPRLNQLLNAYRSQKGCRIIQRHNQMQQLIQALKNNQAIGMTADQGGKRGRLIKFFGKSASLPSGAVRISLKYDTPIIASFYTRIRGPYIKVILQPPFKIRKTGELEEDIRYNLEELISVFEKYISLYPQEYLWTYKIWKYAGEKNILVLSDGKTGHLRQAQAVADIASNYLKEKGINTKVDIQEVKFKSKLARYALTLSSCLAGRYNCQGCLWCLRTFLDADVYRFLISQKPDAIISCGASFAPVNFVLSRENLAKSVIVMRPAVLSTRRFDLVIMPRHDNPPKRKNVVITEGALNLINDRYLDDCISKESNKRLATTDKQLVIGLLIGGDTKNFSLAKETIAEVIKQIKSVSEKLDADILVTTSRRTSKEAEAVVKGEFKDYSRCRLLIIANEKNIPEALGAILGLSQIVVTSCESISMISEAVNSKKYVLVFNMPGLSNKHQRFLHHFSKKGYIHLTEANRLSKAIEDIWATKPEIQILKDRFLVKEAIKKLL